MPKAPKILGTAPVDKPFSPKHVYFISLKSKSIYIFHAFAHKKRGKYLLTTISIYILYCTILYSIYYWSCLMKKIWF